MIDKNLIIAFLVIGTLILFALDWITKGTLRTRGVMLAILVIGLIIGIMYALDTMYGYII